jgi:CelD/BcsL family acetyltransferase involved in cellulose biosynthesis
VKGAGAIAGTVRVKPDTTPATSPVGANLTLEVRHDLDWAADDAAAIDALVEANPQVGVFLTNAWLSGFFDDPPPGFEPSIFVVREQGALRGLVPLATRRTFTHARVTLLGGGAGSDRVDLLAARGYEATCSDLFIDWIGRSFGPKGFVLELRDVPGESPLWGAIRRAGVERRLRPALVPCEVHALPYLNLEESFSSPGESPSPCISNSTAKHRRWLERRGLLKIDVLQDADEVMFTFDLLAQWLRARWGRSASALNGVRPQRFHHHVLPRLLREGRLSMIRVLADMRPIAAFYGLTTGTPVTTAARSAGPGRWWGYYLAGFDRHWAGRIHLGQITIAAAIDLASRDGASEFDFLKGAERVKYQWPVRERVTVDADLYSGQAGAQLTRATRATREAAAALTRSARDLLSGHARP